MAEEIGVGCVRPKGGPAGENVPEKSKVPQTTIKDSSAMIQIGKKAPDFVTPGYYKEKFISAKLSDYLGKWVLLCQHRIRYAFRRSLNAQLGAP